MQATACQEEGKKTAQNMLVRDISGWRQREKNLLVPLRACSLLDYHMVKRRGSVTPSEDCNREWFTPENSSTENALSGSLRYFSFLCCCSFHSKKKKKKARVWCVQCQHWRESVPSWEAIRRPEGVCARCQHPPDCYCSPTWIFCSCVSPWNGYSRSGV